MAGRQLHQLDVVQLNLKAVRRQLADINSQGVPWSDCNRKEGLVVHACAALDLSVAGFEPSGMDHSWLEIDWGRNVNQSIAKYAIQHQYSATGSTLLESPTAVSVTWLWHRLYVCSHGRWNVSRFVVQLQLWWYCAWRCCPTLTRHISVAV